jgi:hypothetical protein
VIAINRISNGASRLIAHQRSGTRQIMDDASAAERLRFSGRKTDQNPTLGHTLEASSFPAR